MSQKGLESWGNRDIISPLKSQLLLCEFQWGQEGIELCDEHLW